MPKVSKSKSQRKAGAHTSVIKKEEGEDDVFKPELEPGPSPKSHVNTEKEKIKQEDIKKGEQDIKPKKEEQIGIMIKQEGLPDQLRHVSLMPRGPNSEVDIFDLSQFGLPPEPEFDEKYNQGFSRQVIGKAFGGNHQNVTSHWQGPAKRPPGREAFMAFNTKFNPNLFPVPGKHGVLLTGSTMSKYEDGSPVLEAVPLFVARGANDWVMTGSYDLTRSGTIPAQYIQHLPPWCITTWVAWFVRRSNGRQWVTAVNQRLADEAALVGEEPDYIPLTEEGIMSALTKGHISVSFTIAECVGYREDWFERLLEAEEEVGERPKSRRAGEDPEGSPPKKKRRGTTVKKEEGIEEKVKGEEDFKDEKDIEARGVKKVKKEGSGPKEVSTKSRLKKENTEGTRKSTRVRKTPAKIKEYILVESDDDFETVDGVEEATLL